MVSITSNSLLHPDEITRKTFPTARRGLDAEAVRRYLETLANDLRVLLEREAQLRHRLADAERRAAEPEIDEAMLTRAVGVETARILETAHVAARDVIANAEARAAQLVEESEGLVAERSAAADEEAAGILFRAEQDAVLLAAATVEEATALRETARQEADELITAAGGEAAAVLAATKEECRQMVREARELRHRVLNDLAERRRALRVQLAQLRTGRDSLIEVVDAVGDAVDRVRDRWRRPSTRRDWPQRRPVTGCRSTTETRKCPRSSSSCTLTQRNPGELARPRQPPCSPTRASS